MNLTPRLTIALILCSVFANPTVRADEIFGDWSLQLQSGTPAWMTVRSGDTTPIVRLRLYVGPDGPHTNVKYSDGRLSFTLRQNKKAKDVKTVEAGLKDGKLAGVVKSTAADGTIKLDRFTGTRIPALPKSPPELSKVHFGHPISLFNGKSLDGWRAHEPDKIMGWSVRDGVLTNTTPKTDFSATGDYANLRTEDVFEDFWLHLEFKVERNRNSGVYLRGMYEAQVVDRDSRMQGLQGVGAIFGAIAPSQNAGLPGGQWQTYDITLVNRHVTVVLNGVKVIDNQPIPGPTAGAVFTDPTLPGPIYLQGDHTNVQYRNIYLAPVVKPNLGTEHSQSGEPVIESAPLELDFSAMMQPVPESAIFRSDEYDIWGGAPIRGPDGRYHLFYSRWPRRLGHQAWVTHSEIAHATSESPLGPWKHRGVALPERGGDYWDGHCTHNPTILSKDGKYYLYYMGNRGDRVVEKPLNWTHRNNQRIGVAVADSLDGPWLRSDEPLLTVSDDPDAVDALCVSNPAVTVGPDGQILMVYKTVARKLELPSGGPVGVGIATASSPTGPFHKHDKRPFHIEGERFAAEDPYIWFGGERYYAIVKDRNGHFTGIKGFSLALFTSDDGFDWTPAKNLLVAAPGYDRADGGHEDLVIMERPQLLIENGRPTVLFCAAAKLRNKANGFNVQIPLRLND